MTSGAKAQTGKTGSGSGITQLTGDATAGPGTGSQVLTLQDTSNVTSVVQTILSNNNLSLYENNAIAAGISTPTPLPAQYNVVSVTANYQKVILPNITTLGEYVYIDNSSPYILSVYPYGTQTIDALGAGLPIQLAPSSYWLGVVEATGASGTWASVIASLNGTSPISVTYGSGTVTTALTGIVPVANGGTGVTTSTGTGSVVLSTDPTIISPTIDSPTIGNSGGSYPGEVTFSVGAAGGGGSVQISAPSTQSTNTVLNLPVVTTTPDTLATLAATQTLTNKTISGASNTLSNILLTTAVTGTLPVANGGTASAYGVTPQQQAFALGGSSNVAETFPRLIATNTNTYTIPHFQAVYLYAGQVVNSVKFATGSTAGSALTSQWVGLFDSTGLCVSIGTQSLTTMAANNLFNWSLSSAYTVPTSGLYYVGIGIYGTTSPVYPTFVGGPGTGPLGEIIWGSSPVLQYTSGSAATVPTVGTTTFTPALSATNGIYSSLQ